MQKRLRAVVVFAALANLVLPSAPAAAAERYDRHYSYDLRANGHSVAVTDFDVGGPPEIVITAWDHDLEEQQLHVYQRHAQRTELRAIIPIVNAGQDAFIHSDITVGDVRGGRRREVLVSVVDRVYIFRARVWQPLEHIHDRPVRTIVLPGPVLGLEAVDWDVDGDVDVLAGVQGSGFHLLRNDGDGLHPVVVASAQFTAMAVGDLDLDGRPDVAAVATGLEPLVTILLNRPSGPPSVTSVSVEGRRGCRHEGIAVGDVVGDDFPEVALAYNCTEVPDGGVMIVGRTVYERAYSVRQVIVGNHDDPVYSHPTAFAVREMNGDRHLDLVVAHDGADLGYLWHHRGRQLLHPEEQIYEGPDGFWTGIYGPSPLVFADVIADGQTDAILLTQGNLVIFRGEPF